MKLSIDTSSNQETIVRLDKFELKKSSSVWRSQLVLPMIEEALKKTENELSDVTEIEVCTGPGSYTGLKVGVAIANALGFSLKIPVNGQKITEKSIIEPNLP